MKYLIFILSTIMFYSCDSINGSGRIQNEKRNVGHFDGVQTSGSIDVEITNNQNVSVEVEADDNVLPYIITEVNRGLLDVHYKDNTSFNNVHAKVYVAAPSFNTLSIEGSGGITSKNSLKNNETIVAKIAGSGNIKADVDAPEIKGDIEGSGTLNLQGRCKKFSGNIDGSGDLKCKDLLSENAIVNINGSGTAHVFASVQLKAVTAGSGDIYYSGNPPSTQINKAGSGTIEAEK